MLLREVLPQGFSLHPLPRSPDHQLHPRLSLPTLSAAAASGWEWRGTQNPE